MARVLPNLKPLVRQAAGVADQPTARALRAVEDWAHQITERLARLDLAVGDTVVGGVSSVNAGSSAVSVSPTVGAVVVDVVEANFSGIPQGAVTNLVADLSTINTTLAGKVDGSGTLNVLPKWTPDGNTLGDSRITDDGTNITAASTTGNTLVVNYTGSSGADRSALDVTNSGTATAGTTTYGTRVVITATGPLESGHHNVAVYASATGGQGTAETANYSFYGASGTLYNAGILAIDGAARLGNGTGDAHSLVGTLSLNGTAGSSGEIAYVDGANGPKWGTPSSAGIPTGTGTANRLVRWTGVNTQGNANVTDDGSTVTVNLATLNVDSGGGAGRLKFAATGSATYIEAGLNSTSGSAAPLVFTNMNAAAEWGRFDGSGNFTLEQAFTVKGNAILGNATTDSHTVNGLLNTKTPAATIPVLRMGKDGATTLWGIGHHYSDTDFSFNYYDGTSWSEDLVQISSAGNLALAGTLTVNGNVTLGDAGADSHTVKGSITLNSGGGTTTVAGNLTVNSGSLVTIGSATSFINGNATSFSGNISVDGNATLGNASTDTHTVNGSLTVTTGLTVNSSGLLVSGSGAQVNGDCIFGSASTNTHTLKGNLSLQDSPAAGPLKVGSTQARVYIGQQVFTSSGTYTPTTGTKAVRVRMVGGGGGGGGAGGGASARCAGGGGSSGVYWEKWIAPGASITGGAVTIGSGGAGGTSGGGTGGNGDDTSVVIQATTYTAKGGTGNTGLASSGDAYTYAVGPQTGSTAGYDFIAGSPGTAGMCQAGGTLVVAGVGGSNPFGIGGATPSDSVGTAGVGYGAGGGGGNHNGTTDRAGGAGTAGLVIIDEYA
jgi:hypothetical protein